MREEYLYEPDGSLLTKGFREIYHTALKKPFMLKHFLYALIYIRIIIVNYIVNLILKKNLILNKHAISISYFVRGFRCKAPRFISKKVSAVRLG